MDKYEIACQFIAYYDDPEETDINKIADQTTVCLVATVFNKAEHDIAQNVMEYRNAH